MKYLNKFFALFGYVLIKIEHFPYPEPEYDYPEPEPEPEYWFPPADHFPPEQE